MKNSLLIEKTNEICINNRLRKIVRWTDYRFKCHTLTRQMPHLVCREVWHFTCRGVAFTLFKCGIRKQLTRS
ncbi:hypothetical protein DXA61_10810 [Bacteroides intestinalis]|uniref:Uncharacterized protein n=1 Tax=Bacteroides intestinalis TaxID=329854 RepID=A0AAQ0RQ23_9BACE|nr:hypothetical protein DWX27_22700 [Bacteroides intestinalis]RGX84977.1 hypothetical protein DXA61_10810 [Bacteroides intestinalis]